MICRHILFMAAVLSASAAPPSFTTGCNQEIGCETGFYCGKNFICRPCLRCQDLKREPPHTPMACVTSILECGQCIDGLIQDRVTSECILPIEQDFPTWTIVVIVVGSLLLFSLICVIAAYMLRNLPYFKIFASTAIHPPCDDDVEEASAPPPPYNSVALLPKAQPVEESLPFIQAIPNEYSSGKREPVERQAARVFRDPAYLRNPHVGPTFETQINRPVLESLPEVHEESISLNDIRTNNDELMRVQEATEEPSIAPQPPKARVRQDSNNSSHTEENEDSAHTFFNSNCAPFIFNVINNVTTTQLNDVRI